MTILPCADGCRFNKRQCKYVKDCEEDIQLSLGLYYFWEKGQRQPRHGDRPKANRPIGVYRKRDLPKQYEER